MKKRFLALGLTLSLICSMAVGCSSKESQENSQGASKTDYKIGMVTNVGGVNDQSFCQSAWEGLQELRDEQGVQVSYIESTQESDYTSNLDKMLDNNNDFVWSIGFSMADAALQVAKMNADQKFGIVDHSYGDETPDNVVCVMFRAQEPSFLVGYIAGYTTKTDKVGFVGGIGSDILDQFEYGYRAGVEYAAKEQGKEITVAVQYAESFTDAARGKAIANKMFHEGADIVFHAAGSVGLGVIEAAKDAGNWAIGVDMDQYNVAPEAVLTSAVKRVDEAMKIVANEYMKGSNLGGTTIEYGLNDGAVGLPKENPNVPQELLDKTAEVEQLIIKGDVKVPFNKQTYTEFSEWYKLTI